MHISTRTFILLGIIALTLAAGAAYLMNRSTEVEPLPLPPPDAGKDTQTALWWRILSKES